MDDQNKNLILATALSFLVIMVWFLLFPPEEIPVDPNATAPSGQVTEDLAAAPPAAQTVEPAASTAQPAQTGLSETPLEDAARIAIETPNLSGSISLTGGRIDDLSLNNYKETLDEDSENVTLLAPVGSESAYYALYGWAPAGDLTYDDVPGANTPWELKA